MYSEYVPSHCIAKCVGDELSIITFVEFRQCQHDLAFPVDVTYCPLQTYLQVPTQTRR